MFKFLIIILLIIISITLCAISYRLIEIDILLSKKINEEGISENDSSPV